jgi:hypothetical protein
MNPVGAMRLFLIKLLQQTVKILKPVVYFSHHGVPLKLKKK